MVLKITVAGSIYNLESMNLRALSEAWEIGLFKNNVTPGSSTGWGHLVECDFPGYARKPWGTWEGPFPVGGAALMERQNVTWTTASAVGLPQTVYGWFLLKPFENLVAAERWPGAPLSLTMADQDFVAHLIVQAQNLP